MIESTSSVRLTFAWISFMLFLKACMRWWSTELWLGLLEVGPPACDLLLCREALASACLDLLAL